MRVLLALLAVCSFAAPVSVSAQVPAMAPISGVVVDQSGAAVPEATVLVRQPGLAERRVITGADGRFSLDAAATMPAELVVRARGFAQIVRTLPAAGDWAQLQITLATAGVAEALTVTATRSEQQLGAVPASVTIMGRAEIQRSAATVADDVLRRLPAFSLFRRMSSLSSHPTAQGVSLRGIGPSGVSRTLVLLDGVPFNDPFGGWVYWTRVPLDSADRIEVVDGSTSNLYGNYAMGGVINIVTRPPAPRSLDIRTQYGSRNSPKVDVRASDVWGRLGAAVDVSAFDTEGFAVVAPGERGLVDTKAAVDYTNVNLRLQYDATDRVQAFAHAGYFREERDNAKVSTITFRPEANSTRMRTIGGGVRARLANGDQVEARIFGESETFHSNFLAVPQVTPARSLGRTTLNQRVPTRAMGALTQWSRSIGARHAVSAGVDWRLVKGESQEEGLDAVTGTTVVLRRESGGRQQSVGAFVQDIVAVTDALTVTGSVRLDRWVNTNGRNLEFSEPSGTPTAGHRPELPEQSDTTASPRIAALYTVNEWAKVWASVGAGFRAPTLNELYRQFRVGTVLTLPNHELGPERLVGSEAGIRVMPLETVSMRATWFDNRVKDPVSNVTIATAGTQVTQQRQNLGRTRIHGLQADLEYRPTPAWRVSAAYLYSHATVKEFDANPALVGKFLAQVPRHRAAFELSYVNPRFVDVSLDIQAVGAQFDDDQNARVVPGYTDPGLPKYAVVSVFASRRVNRSVDLFAGAQNLLNQEYYVGTLPTTIGTPRMVTAGVRLHLAGR